MAVGLFVDEFGICGERAVGFDDLAADRRVDVAGRLDGFDDGAGFAGFDFAADLRDFGEDDVSQLGLGVVADADGGDVAREADPFVAFGKFQISRNVAHIYSGKIATEVGGCKVRRGGARKIEPPRHKDTKRTEQNSFL